MRVIGAWLVVRKMGQGSGTRRGEGRGRSGCSVQGKGGGCARDKPISRRRSGGGVGSGSLSRGGRGCRSRERIGLVRLGFRGVLLDGSLVILVTHTFF